MSAPPQLEAVVCPECGAENVRGAQRCFLCYGSLNPYADNEPTAQSPDARPALYSPRTESGYGVATMLTLVLVALVGTGLFLNEPGLGIGFVVLCAPALIATGATMLQSNSTTGQISWVRAFNTFVLSVAITFGVIVALIVAAVVGLFVICSFSM